MRILPGLAAAASLAAGAATAAPSVEIKNAAVRVVVIPENRTDVQVTVLKSSASLPLYITRVGDGVVVDGRLPHFWRNCRGDGENLRIGVFGRGDFGVGQFPSIVVKTPMDAKVWAGDAVLGSIGRARTVDLHNSGCGDWTVANTEDVLVARVSGSGNVAAGSAGSADLHLSGAGKMKVGAVRGLLTSRISGSGSVTAGPAGEADLTISGAGNMRTGAVSRGLHGRISGSGDVDVDSLNGPMDVIVSGVGHVRVPKGAVTTLQARISGTGGVTFGGVAENLDANVSGAGSVSAATVTGSVTKRVSGVGQVRIGNGDGGGSADD